MDTRTRIRLPRLERRAVLRPLSAITLPAATPLATSLAEVVAREDACTRSHSEVVSVLCAGIAGELGLSRPHGERLVRASLLHDIGKTCLPEAILLKPGALTYGELELVRTHSQLGYEMAVKAGLLDEALWILHHHERPDGRGYPYGLAGDEIPLESRAIHVADAFEAMIADRPYRRGRSAEEALVELRLHAGTQFDHACVAALERVVQDRFVDVPAAGAAALSF